MRPGVSASPTKAAPIRGILLSLFVSITFLAFGVLLIPLLIGIPLALVGALFLILSPFAGSAARAGACPNCGASMLVVPLNKATKCRSCKHRIKIVDTDFVDVT
jgi:hypothetical protein